MDAQTRTAVMMGFIKTMILMKHKGMTKEQAMRVHEFEFEFDDKDKTLTGLEYWLGNGRRKTNYRRIDLSADAEFDEMFTKGVLEYFEPPTPAPAHSNAPSTD
jgi:hypothetical protein